MTPRRGAIHHARKSNGSVNEANDHSLERRAIIAPGASKPLD
jgi:hypothetical protein